jgi:lysophospholipase L1-like esterase
MGDRPYLKTPQFKSATAYNPDIVIMMLGTNDSKPHIWTHKDRYSKDLTFLIDHFAALPSKPKIFLCTPAWVIMEFTDNINRETVNGQIVPIVRSIAEEKNIPLIDVYSAFKGKPELFVDGVHPNEAGAVVLAKTVAKAIESELTDSAMKSDVK